MGLFTDIGEGIAAVTGAVSDAVSDYQRNRRKTKALKYEKQLAEDLISEGARTYTGIATGDSPYSSAAETAAAIGSISGPVAGAVTDSISAFYGFKGIAATAEAAKGAVGAVSEALGGVVGGAADAVTEAVGAVTAGDNNVRTPLGDVNVTTAAIVAGAVVVALVLTRDGR